MAKANRRFRGKHKTHSAEDEYKIPLRYRKHNKDKWTDRKKYLRIMKEKGGRYET